MLTFEQFLSTQQSYISVGNFMMNVVIAAVLAYILRYIYIRFGFALSNRTRFANNFVLIAVTTMVVITIVKSSLALSLGLVGALSIVRFRTAIKEPEELAYIFLSITLGLGLGASQTLITIIAFVFIAALIILFARNRQQSEQKQMYVTVSADSKAVSLEELTGIMQEHALAVSLKRYDHTAPTQEALFIVHLENVSALEKAIKAVHTKDANAKVRFLDHEEIA